MPGRLDSDDRSANGASMPPAAPSPRPHDLFRAGREGERFSSVEKWVRRRLGQVGHELRVAEIASTVFDLTGPLHALDRADARLLRLAALVHDVGRSVDQAEHPVHGAGMVLAD